MSETWFVLEDDSVGDPRDIAPGKDGMLRHKDGRAVAYAAHGPRTRGGIDPQSERARAKAPKAKPPVRDPDGDEPSDKTPSAAATKTRDLKAEEPKRGYKTRESKAD